LLIHLPWFVFFGGEKATRQKGDIPVFLRQLINLLPRTSELRGLLDKLDGNEMPMEVSSSNNKKKKKKKGEIEESFNDCIRDYPDLLRPNVQPLLRKIFEAIVKGWFPSDNAKSWLTSAFMDEHRPWILKAVQLGHTLLHNLKGEEEEEGVEEEEEEQEKEKKERWLVKFEGVDQKWLESLHHGRVRCPEGLSGLLG
jgi:hypothetical protein